MNPELVKFWEKHYDKVFTTGKTETMEFQYTSPQEEKYYLNTRIVPEFVDGKVTSILAISHDITELKQAEAKLKETLDNLERIVEERTAELERAYNSLKEIETARKQEIHHRIKNNLQVISSLLDLQSDKFNKRECIKDSEVLEAFRESQARVISMALIHEELYKGGGFETLNFSPYISKLTENLLQTYSVGNTNIDLKLNIAENIFLDMDIAVPLGIIINELVTNSFKHAFSDKKEGEIKIELHREENEDCIKCIHEDCSNTFTLTVSDNGIGVPEDLNIEELDSLGMQLVTSLVDQLDGKLELKRDNGTEFTIRFAVNEKDNQLSTPPLQLVD
jgi:two-component sensor histidine kinase